MKACALFLCLALTVAQTAFAKFPYWTEEKEETKAVTLSDFVAKLSDYHHRRFARFSPIQKKTAYAYFEKEQYSADDAVDQVSRDELLRR